MSAFMSPHLSWKISLISLFVSMFMADDSSYVSLSYAVVFRCSVYIWRLYCVLLLGLVRFFVAVAYVDVV
jgi:hypothetical protein